MKLWKDMSHAEKEGLKAAHHRGRTIQFFSLVGRGWDDCGGAGPSWLDTYAYRVKPETNGETMKLWKDMTACEKGALLLASHEGETLQYWKRGTGGWEDCLSVVIHNNEFYRVKPKPVVTEVVRYGQVCNGVEPWGGGFAYTLTQGRKDTHKITFNLVDGEPDCNSIKMEKL